MNSELQITLDEVLPKLPQSLQRKLLHGVDLLRKAEKLAFAYDSENGFYLAFSGGKDSQCLYHVAKFAGVKFKAHMNLTSVDPPEVIRFVKKNYPEVELIKPCKSIFQHAIEKQILPTMRVRWCCAEYKETAGAGKVTLIGIRRAESSRRAKRNEVEINNRKFSGDLEGLEGYRKALNANKRGRKPKNNREVTIVNADGERTLGCIRGQESLLISPIIEWTDDDVWNFLNTLGVAHCELYDQGWHRIGCIGCPMSSHKQKMIENERYPHVKRNWIKAIKAIRNGGVGIQKRLHLVEHPQGLDASQKRQRIAQDTGGYIKHPDPEHWIRLDSTNNPTGYKNGNKRRNTGIWSLAMHGFSPSSSSDRLTEEQENEIAENIYDWWISGKSYKQWYAEKFQQLDLFDKH